MNLTITIATEEVVLLPDRALFWPRMATLFVADLHFGKAATLRAAAIAMPGGTTSDDLLRLERALLATAARRLVLLGDLIHAKAGRAERTLAAVTAWRERWPNLELLLVRGNHDARAGDPPAEWGITVADAPLAEPPFVLRHFPDESPDGYTLAGHLHPGLRLQGAGRQQLTLPCFCFGPRVGILPAFGSFTGTAQVQPTSQDRIFVIAEEQIIAVAHDHSP